MKTNHICGIYYFTFCCLCYTVGSSSIGSLVNAPFLAAFSAAAGKRSFQFESEESDPGVVNTLNCYEYT